MPSEKRKQVEPSAKFGKLTIIYIASWYNDILCVCQCECFRIVKVSPEELETRTACLDCESRQELENFADGDIVIFRNAIGEIPFGEQAIVNRLINTERISAVEIEWRGQLYKCRPSELESLGVNFYEYRKTHTCKIER